MPTGGTTGGGCRNYLWVATVVGRTGVRCVGFVPVSRGFVAGVPITSVMTLCLFRGVYPQGFCKVMQGLCTLVHRLVPEDRSDFRLQSGCVHLNLHGFSAVA